jgi:uncharacterized protein (DUF2267 family)
VSRLAAQRPELIRCVYCKGWVRSTSILDVEHKERREHLQRLLDDLSSQRKVNPDEVLMELIHLVLELEDEIGQLRARLSQPGAES